MEFTDPLAAKVMEFTKPNTGEGHGLLWQPTLAASVTEFPDSLTGVDMEFTDCFSGKGHGSSLTASLIS